MHALSALLVLTAASMLSAHTCDRHSGCKIFDSNCQCEYGCKNEYIYKTRRECLHALRERSANVCFQMPCLRGICIQTAQDPGYSCKCDSTGFYGQRCEKACPTVLMRGQVVPHECIVI